MNYNVHKKVFLKLNNSREPYSSYFSSELSYFNTNSGVGTPVVTIDFVEKLEYTTPISYISENMIYDSSYYYTIINKKHFGFNINPSEIKIVCEYGIDPLYCFYMTEIMLRNLITKSGAAFVHASGIVQNNRSIIFPAWGGTGKTNILIQFLLEGAEYIGDDLIIVDEKGVVYPYPKRINLLWYNFEEYKKLLLPVASLNTKLKYFQFNILKKIYYSLKLEKINSINRISKFFLEKFADECNERIQLNKIFPRSKIAKPAPIQFVMFLIRVSGSKLEIKSIGPESLAKRISNCLKWERNYFGDQSLPYLFAFPNKRTLINSMLNQEEKIIEKSFKKAENMYMIKLGENLKIGEIYNKIARFIEMGE